MKKNLTATVIALAVLSSMLLPIARDAAAVQKSSSLEERIEKIENGLLPPVMIVGQSTRMRLADRMQFYKVPGMSIAVINNGIVEWARGYGVKEASTASRVTAETLFQAASISKPVTAMAALRLVEEGKLNLDEDINEKLVSWKVPDNEYTKLKKVTLRHLLSHSSGLTYSIGAYGSDEKRIPTLLEALDGTNPLKPKPVRVEFVPGSRWQYSGGGFSVLQQLLIDVTGSSFSELMDERVLKRLGMKQSYFLQPLSTDLATSAATGHQPNGEPHPGKWRVLPEMAAGGLWSTPSDIARFAVELQNSIPGKSNKVLSQQMASQMLTRQVKDWGLGITVQGEGKAHNFSHTGWNRGFRSFLIAFTETGQGAVVMTNGDSTGVELIWELIRGIATEYGWPKHRTKERILAQVDSGIFKAYVGQYEVEPGLNFTVSTENDRLFILGGPLGKNKVELYPESEERYFVTAADVAFTFTKDGLGEVKEMIIQPAETPRTARKIK